MTYIGPLNLGCAAENLVPPADAGANLVVLGFGVAERVELGQRGHQRSTKPYGVAGIEDEYQTDKNKTRGATGRRTVDACGR